MDFHLMLESNLKSMQLLLRHPQDGGVVEETIHQLLIELVPCADEIVRNPSQIRAILEWNSVPFASSSFGDPLSHAYYPTRMVGIVVEISKPEMISYSAAYSCQQCPEIAPEVFRLDSMAGSAALQCPGCHNERVELEAGRNEYLAQRIALSVGGQLLRARGEVVLVTPESRFLSPLDLGVQVMVSGSVMTRVSVDEKRKTSRMRRQLQATSIHKITRPPRAIAMRKAHLLPEGPPMSRLAHIFGKTDAFLFEKLCMHVVILSGVLKQAEEHHTGIPRKLSALFFGPTSNPMMDALVGMEGKTIGSRETVLLTPSAGTIMPRFVTNKPRSEWLSIEAGIAHLARDELLVVPHLDTVPGSEQLQLASIIEKGCLSSNSLAVPHLECAVAVLGWCLVPEDAKFRKFRRGEMTLAQVWGKKIQSLLLQNMDLVWHVEDQRDVDDILAGVQTRLIDEQSLAWVRHVSVGEPVKLSQVAKQILSAYHHCRQQLTGMSKREMERLFQVSKLIAILLDAATVQEFHCYLAISLSENSLRWKSIPNILGEGIPTRNMEDFMVFQASLQKQFHDKGKLIFNSDEI